MAAILICSDRHSRINLFNVDPVLLCNDLGQVSDLSGDAKAQPVIDSSGRSSMSIKESARIAQSNNFMGLICRSNLLVLCSASSTPVCLCTNMHKNVMPSLVESIKEMGLVLVADTSDDTGEAAKFSNFSPLDNAGISGEWSYRMPDGVNGVMRGSGVLRFNDTIDM